MNTYIKIGLLGLLIQAAVNLVALLVFKQSSAEFFSEQWWSSWFPTYTVWFVFSFIGLGNRSKKNDGGERRSMRLRPNRSTRPVGRFCSAFAFDISAPAWLSFG
jgi:hypothetical protein